ncbi:EAL domain-containing protein [Halomonas vilamensis]|uniref:EAL domain-containing protein n=1 Tax=Vreelandella vilamensis TaxID=531309 RepID=A0ABU1H5A4_9GAMM|nr:EAL domain-containing protein [Halomonas vilamensis]MDR5898693.1 EAL domain-containing protein [Halomonas vilamensis]
MAESKDCTAKSFCLRWLTAGFIGWLITFPAHAIEPGIQLSDAEKAYLEANEPIVFVSQRAYPPFEFVDDDGERQGMMVELAHWIATEAGFHAQFVNTDFSTAQAQIQNGDADVLTSFFYSKSRDQHFDFTQTIFEVPAAIFVRADRPDMARLLDLDGRRVATQRDDYAEEYLEESDIEVELVSTRNFADAAQAVINGEADAMIGDEQIVLYHLYREGLNDEMKRVGEPLYTGLNAMAVIDGNQPLQSILNKGIDQARAQGTLDRLNEKWLGQVLPSARINWRDYWPHALIVIVAALWVIAWNLRLRQLVRRKTRELRHNQKRLTEILHATRTATWELDVASGQLRVNDCWAEILGYAPEELTLSSVAQWRRWVHPDDLEEAEQALNNHLRGHTASYSCEFRLRHRDGHWLWVLDRGKVTSRNAQGQALKASGTRIDISTERHAESDLRLAASVFHNAHDAILLADSEGMILNANAAFTLISGIGAEEVLHTRATLLDHLSDGQEVWQGEVTQTRKSGEHYPTLVTISRVDNRADRSAHYVIVFTDISRQKEYENRLEHLAYFDCLTDLPNRERLTQHLAQAMANARRHGHRVVLAYLDLDGFKEINDTYGHPLGDQVLKVIAERLRGTVDGDTVARLGGDEFVIMLLHQHSDDAMQRVITTLIQRVNQPMWLAGHELRVSASVGVAYYVGQPNEDHDDIEPDQFIRQADHAMYQAKQLGKNRYHIFDSAHERAVRGHHQSIARMQQALDNDEFVLFYQPKINMQTGEVIGVEALIRWQHPDKGLLPPAAFLSDLQQHSLAIAVGEWVVNTAIAQFCAWQARGVHLPVSINIDGIHLQHPGFADWLQQTLSRYPQVKPGDIEIEVLESSALDDIHCVAEIMRHCQRLGAHFALDDFGTGYASLAYLRYLPVGQLKIDRSFVFNMLDNEEDLVMLKGVLSLAKAFQRRVIAEGVETYAHARALLALGCEYGQGYAFARPMPASEILPWVERFVLPDATITPEQ